MIILKVSSTVSKIQNYTQTRADPPSKFMGGDISDIWQFTHSLTVKEMKYTSQHCCDKTMDSKMTFYRECCFPNCSKSWCKKVTFVGLMGSDRPSPLDPPLQSKLWILILFGVQHPPGHLGTN